MMNAFLVFIGGGFGAFLRYVIGVVLVPYSQVFPWATFLINITGSFAIGILAILLPIDHSGHEWRLLLMTGVLGGFTTFSAFSLESAGLWRGGAFLDAALYVGGSVIISLLAVTLGLWLGKTISS